MDIKFKAVYAIVKEQVVEAIIYSDKKITTDIMLKIISNDKNIISNDKNIILSESKTHPPQLGGTFIDGIFRPPQTYKSWIWDNLKLKWIPPTPYPEGGPGYFWNEKKCLWEEIPNN